MSVAVVAVAVATVATVAVVAIPGISISSGVSHSRRVGSSGGLCLSLCGPLSVAIVAVSVWMVVAVSVSVAVVAVAIMAVPGISISRGVSSSGGLCLSLCGPLSVQSVAIVAMRPVVSTVSVATVSIAIPGSAAALGSA